MESFKEIKKNENLIFVYDEMRNLLNRRLTDEKLIKKQFKKRVGRELNLNEPHKYNDKLQWLKLNWYDPLATKCADKYKVREYIESKIGGRYLNKLINVYDTIEDIDIEKLPNSFVLKGTHGSGYNIICENKNDMNWKKEYNKMKGWMRNNYYWSKREWVYKDIKPRIICEEFMRDKSGKPPKDYKIFCFNGEPKIIQVDVDRFENHVSNIYDTHWNYLNIEIENPTNEDIKLKKPYLLNEMLKLSKVLSEPFPHVRVDFYNYNEKVIFGELTFFHHSGMGKFTPSEFEDEMGNWLELPKHISRVY